MRALDYNLYDIGFNEKKILFQIPVIILGVGFGIADYFILRPGSLVTGYGFEWLIFPSLTLIISTGFIEELAFRGVMQQSTSIFGNWGWIFVAITYSILQISHGNFLHCLFILVVSIIYGWVVKKTGSLVGVSISHGLLNIVLFLVLPNILTR
jgi:uncharacterized protein